MTFHKVLLFQLNVAPVNSCITANLLKFKIRKHKVTIIHLKIVMTSIHFLYYIQNISHSHIIASPQIKISLNENP